MTGAEIAAFKLNVMAEANNGATLSYPCPACKAKPTEECQDPPEGVQKLKKHGLGRFRFHIVRTPSMNPYLPQTKES